jgi:hypothetical protein
VRLIFVADEIPTNSDALWSSYQQMDPAEVLAVEIKQYVGGDLKTFVPRVMGQTVEAQQKKSSVARESRQWDEPSFFEDLGSRQSADAVRVAGRILDWAKANGLRIWWGKGAQDGSFFPMLDHRGESHWTISVWTYGRLEVQFQQMKVKLPLDDQSKRQELLRRLNEIPGVAIPADGITRRPSIPLSLLKDEAVLSQFLATFDWVIQEIRAS